MNPLEVWLRGELYAFLLASTRATGIIAVAPLAWAGTPVRIRVVLVMLLGFVGQSQIPGTIEWPPFAGAIIPLIGELTIGVALGLVVRIAVAVPEMVGDLVAPVIGLGAAQAFDPVLGGSHGEIGRLLRYLTVFLALVVGVHRVLLQMLISSFRVLVPGAPLRPAAALPALLTMVATSLVDALRIALPIIAVLFMIQVALAFISRAAPSMQVFNIGFTVTLSVGIVLLIILMPDLARGFLSELSHTGARMESLLLDLGATP
jgi:flagellar biosynthetic protein FliR